MKENLLANLIPNHEIIQKCVEDLDDFIIHQTFYNLTKLKISKR